jgi:hypothetical protein
VQHLLHPESLVAARILYDSVEDSRRHDRHDQRQVRARNHRDDRGHHDQGLRAAQSIAAPAQAKLQHHRASLNTLQQITPEHPFVRRLRFELETFHALPRRPDLLPAGQA